MTFLFFFSKNQTRSVFRVYEFSQGYDSGPVHNETLMYIFDMALMLGCIVVFHFVHPGMALREKQKTVV